MLKDQRYIILTITIALTGCASKATDRSRHRKAKIRQTTSWHCEQDADTCRKRRTIADIRRGRLPAEVNKLIGHCPQANKTRSRADFLTKSLKRANETARETSRETGNEPDRQAA